MASPACATAFPLDVVPPAMKLDPPTAEAAPHDRRAEIAAALAADDVAALSALSYEPGAPVQIVRAPGALAALFAAARAPSGKKPSSPRKRATGEAAAAAAASNRASALQALSNLAVPPALRAGLVAAGLVDLVLPPLEAPGPLRGIAAGALLLLACSPECQAPMVDAGAPLALRRASEGKEMTPKEYHLIKTAVHRLGGRLTEAGKRDLLHAPAAPSCVLAAADGSGAAAPPTIGLAKARVVGGRRVGAPSPKLGPASGADEPPLVVLGGPDEVLSPRLSSGFFGGDADFVHQMVAGDANAKRPLPKLESDFFGDDPEFVRELVDKNLVISAAGADGAVVAAGGDGGGTAGGVSLSAQHLVALEQQQQQQHQKQQQRAADAAAAARDRAGAAHCPNKALQNPKLRASASHGR